MVSGAQYLAGTEAVNHYSRRLASWWHPESPDGGWDVLVTPQLGTPPPRIGELGPDSDLEARLDKMGAVAQFTMPFNLTGQPAVSLPLHWNDDGLPIGVQFAAAFGREDVLLRLAAQLEAAQPWADRHPPTF
jgi:amidase